MKLALTEATLITAGKAVPRGVLVIKGGRITYAGPKTRIPADARIIRLAGRFITPGFIDLHAHGAVGDDFTSAGESGYEKISCFFLKHGTTTLLPTIYPRSGNKFLSDLSRLAGYCRQHTNNSPICGIHLEGPFLNPGMPGVLKPDNFWKATVSNWRRLKKAGENWIRMITLAPEIAGGRALLRQIIKDGVVPSLGHSAAGYDEMESFVKMGLANITHIFNALTPLHHRQLNALVSALLSNKVYAHLIADGVHVKGPMIKLLIRTKGVDKVCLMSDANIACGMPDASYNFSGYKIRVKNGIATNLNGTLAGSVITLDKMVKYLVKELGIPLGEAINMATINPARALGIDRMRGSLEPGKRADLAVLDKQLAVRMVFLAGELRYES